MDDYMHDLSPSIYIYIYIYITMSGFWSACTSVLVIPLYDSRV